MRSLSTRRHPFPHTVKNLETTYLQTSGLAFPDMSQATAPNGANSSALAEGSVASVAYAPASEKSAKASSASPSQHSAATSASVGPSVPSTTSAASRADSNASSWAPKLRSCVVCRSRKVRCDKQSPCSNCRRAGIACVVPSGDRPPKWARRLERVTNNAALAAGSTVTSAPTEPFAGAMLQQQQQPQQQGLQQLPSQQSEPRATAQVLDRLRNLEDLVKSLSGQLEQANATISASSNSGSATSRSQEPQGQTPTQGMSTPVAAANSAKSPTNPVGLQKQFGRLVLQDASRSVFVSSAYWSRISDEVYRPASSSPRPLSLS